MSAPIYGELRDTTLSSFLKFIAQRYKSAPVKTGLKAIQVPASEKCSVREKSMTVTHRIESQFDINIRILWECRTCNRTEWRQYGNSLVRERRGKWH